MKQLLLFLLLAVQLHAQDCDPESLRKKAGTWKVGLQGSVKNVSAAELSKEKAVMAAVHQLISARYTPIGNQSQYNSAYGKYVSEGETWLADPYYYTLYVLRYICDKTTFYVNTETPTKVTVAANVYFPNDLYPVLPVSGPRGYLGLKHMPVKKDGYYFMGEEVVEGRGSPSETTEYRWIITYDETLPFVYLTRKEFLLIQKKRLEQDLKDSPDDQAYLSEYLNAITAYLGKPTAELNKIAVYKGQEEQRFTGFAEEGSLGALIAIKPNPAYYRKNLPKSTPQYFSVVFRVSNLSPIYTDNMNALRKAVDFSVLKGMLGK